MASPPQPPQPATHGGHDHEHSQPPNTTQDTKQKTPCTSAEKLPSRFFDPGLSPHRPRRTDTNPAAQQRAQRQVNALFVLAILGGLGFLVAYFAIRITTTASVMLSTQVLGGCLALLLLGVGFGAVHWAKQLMPDHEQVEQRHDIASTPLQRQQAQQILSQGAQEAGMPRRTMIWGSFLAAVALLVPITGTLLRDLVSPKNSTPSPPQAFSHTVWRTGMRLVTDPGRRPVKADDVPIGGVVHVIPDVFNPDGSLRADVPPEAINDHNELTLNALAKAVVLVMRIAPGELDEPEHRKGWSVGGIVAYSKICTHVGCPVALMERTTNHLLCPCHQSTFDAANQCKVIFGPANRPLPQLPLALDNQGYLIAQSDFTEPVGPSFWERR